MANCMYLVFMTIMGMLYGRTCVLGRHMVNEEGWDNANATFYGDMEGNGTMNGACGYGNPIEQGYGVETTALSGTLYNKGFTCGACYEIKCGDSPSCHNGITITVTATNFCPANYEKPNENWCKPKQKHFQLSQPMFRKIAEYQAGVVHVSYRRVNCVKKGGMKFELKGNQYWVMVLVYNVGGVGDVASVKIKGSSTDWMDMSRNWGQNWQIPHPLVGQSLSFQVTASDGKMVQSDDVAPGDWKFGQSYEGKQF